MSLSNPRQLLDMSRAWRDIDFESIRNQAALVCNCRHEDLQQLLEVDFVQVLDGLQLKKNRAVKDGDFTAEPGLTHPLEHAERAQAERKKNQQVGQELLHHER